MRITTRSRYATRMVIDIALHCDEGPVQIGDIARRQNISVKYLEKLIRELRKAGLIRSRRGPQGGHMLARPASEITVGDIVRVLECPPDSDGCDCAEKVCGTCSRAGECITRGIWIETARGMYEKLDSYVIGNLV
ncbi:RrF2 family transcriptional regulator [Pseudodesulfovibrio tunisiensis]|uniref:RrF2 family transcriptional regulator n=1 Tax=Pseudodesulfovibrio tunisiensis TaxID=463192 RepID=UPI001FB459DB|nr:Rrf2 family transcriptional regulator [Pseudodesulfovibrio tunisiensis]